MCKTIARCEHRIWALIFNTNLCVGWLGLGLGWYHQNWLEIEEMDETRTVQAVSRVPVVSPLLKCCLIILYNIVYLAQI